MQGPRDELRELADTFDNMLDRLEAAFTSQRQFIANASHELRTPLTVMRTSNDVVLAKANPTHDELVSRRSAVSRPVPLVCRQQTSAAPVPAQTATESGRLRTSRSLYNKYTSTLGGVAVEFNPFSYEFHENPHPTYAWLRDHAPAYYNSELNFWALSRFSDVLDAISDYGTFSSTGGITIENTGTASDAADQEAPIRSLIDMDPPEHTVLRRMIAPRFTPRQIAALEPTVTRTTRALLDQLANRSSFDVVTEFSALLPTTVIATFLGFAADQHESLRVWTETLLHREPGSAEVTPAGIKAMTQMLDVSARAVHERRANPRDDLLSMLAHADVGGRVPTDAEMLGFCLVLITGGHETTSKLIANGIRLLRQRPEQRAIAMRSAETMRGAVEELLRYTSPTRYTVRTTTRDVTMYDRTIPRGAKVALLLECGNRDPRQFNRPDEIDVTRPNTRILAFGYAAHVCLGAAVARLEAHVALREFLTRYDSYDIDEAGIELLHSGNVHGPSKLPITIH
jgi:cytochrome P450